MSNDKRKPKRTGNLYAVQNSSNNRPGSMSSSSSNRGTKEDLMVPVVRRWMLRKNQGQLLRLHLWMKCKLEGMPLSEELKPIEGLKLEKGPGSKKG